MSRLSSQEPPRFQPPKRGQLWFRIIAGTIVMSAAVILILPFTQALTAGNKDRNIFQVQTANIPPPEPPPPEPPPPPEEPEEQEQPELDEPPPMMDISTLESMLNPGMGGVSVGNMNFDAMQGKATVEDAILYSLRDLDRQPSLRSGGQEDIRRELPPEYRRQLPEVRLILRIRINAEGRVTVGEVRNAPSPEFADAVRRAVSRWIFTPPTVDGKPVTVEYLQPIEISPTD